MCAACSEGACQEKACVNAGNNFKILGTGLYPSMITDVLIDGQPLTAGQYQGLTDSAIGVTAPDISGEALPIVVKTGEGTSVPRQLSRFQRSIYVTCSQVGKDVLSAGV
jgi:hypothetical protein